MKRNDSCRWFVMFVLIFQLMLSPVLCQATTTGQKLNQAERDKANAETQLDKVQDEMQDLHQEKISVQIYLDQLSEELWKLNEKLNEIQKIREEKEQAIADAQLAIAEAKRNQDQRYTDMKKRIRFLYEKGSNSYLELFFEAKSFSDLLNKADYIEQINKYDRKMLAEYQQAEIDIAKQEKELREDKDSLKILETEASDEAMAVMTSVRETGKKVGDYLDQISEKEEQALAYEREIAAKEGDIATLKEQYKQELSVSAQSATMVNRDISDLIFSSGDIDLMAAIIECEAGGESYTGKVAVGAVVLNRVRSPLFQNTVLEVIMAPRQFSPVGSGRFAIVLARGANESCYQAAADAMAGASPVGNCLFFRTPIPGLNGQRLGGHVFY